MEVVPLAPEVAEPLRRFFQRVPEEDQRFFAEDVFAPGVVEGWLADSQGSRAVAVDDGEVRGYVAVLPLVGWSSHVGSVRVVVDPAVRGRGIGRELARTALVTGVEKGLTKLVVEVVADAVATVGLFESLGYEPEALLRDHVRDRAGELRDLLVLAHFAEAAWEGMAAAGLEEELA
jgi:ribosomal protein S18 acetylase RimI-like enzyme